MAVCTLKWDRALSRPITWHQKSTSKDFAAFSTEHYDGNETRYATEVLQHIMLITTTMFRSAC